MVILLSLYKHPKAASLLNRLDGLFFPHRIAGLHTPVHVVRHRPQHDQKQLQFALGLANHAVMAFLTGSKKKWVRTYWLLTAAGLTLLLISWYFFTANEPGTDTICSNADLPIIRQMHVKINNHFAGKGHPVSRCIYITVYPGCRNPGGIVAWFW